MLLLLQQYVMLYKKLILTVESLILLKYFHFLYFEKYSSTFLKNVTFAQMQPNVHYLFIQTYNDRL